MRAAADCSEEFTAAKNHFVDNFDGGESMLKVAARVYNILDEMKRTRIRLILS